MAPVVSIAVVQQGGWEPSMKNASLFLKQFFSNVLLPLCPWTFGRYLWRLWEAGLIWLGFTQGVSKLFLSRPWFREITGGEGGLIRSLGSAFPRLSSLLAEEISRFLVTVCQVVTFESHYLGAGGQKVRTWQTASVCHDNEGEDYKSQQKEQIGSHWTGR
jgi:hypothetical protein